MCFFKRTGFGILSIFFFRKEPKPGFRAFRGPLRRPEPSGTHSGLPERTDIDLWSWDRTLTCTWTDWLQLPMTM